MLSGEKQAVQTSEWIPIFVTKKKKNLCVYMGFLYAQKTTWRVIYVSSCEQWLPMWTGLD